MSFGQRLKEARGNKKLTQAEVAKILGIDDTTISKYENDKSEPDNETLKRLSALYEVSVGYIMGDKTKDEVYDKNKTNFIIDGLVKKYDIDLSIEGERDKLEQLIKLYADLRKP